MNFKIGSKEYILKGCLIGSLRQVQDYLGLVLTLPKLQYESKGVKFRSDCIKVAKSDSVEGGFTVYEETLLERENSVWQETPCAGVEEVINLLFSGNVQGKT
jgi:hypothetical protein